MNQLKVDRHGTFTLDERALSMGATLGGPRLTMTLLANGAIDRIHSMRTGTDILGGLDIHVWDAQTGLRLARQNGSVELTAAYQRNTQALESEIELERTAFVANGDERLAESAFVRIVLRNRGARTIRIASAVSARIKGESDEKVRVRARMRPTNGTLVFWDAERSASTRTLSVSRVPTAWTVNENDAWLTADRLQALPERVSADVFEPIALLCFDDVLEAGASVAWFVHVSGTASSPQSAAETPWDPVSEGSEALETTIAWYERCHERSVVLSPSPTIDLGVYWAKVNVLRVLRDAPTGCGFSNDPGKSPACVGRDAAWFVHGCDWLVPEFGEALVDAFAQRQEDDGKIVEWFDLITGEVHDDGLNVNDDTPLFVLAAWHHAVSTRDRAFAVRVYPHVRRAVEQLLAQRDERGLVFCRSTKTGARGIAGWRNVIRDYRLSGATTEINSATFGALHKAAALAEAIEEHADASRYRDEAARLRASIERDLVNPQNGLYYLALDTDGGIRSDVTADVVFPLIYGVTDTPTSEKIVERLHEEDFWTEAGIRTVPRSSSSYHPTRGSGLLGGVWAGLTLWYAFGASRFVPNIMRDALENAFGHLQRDPLTNSTVPGEFAEWLNGESLVNGGMNLSPWFAPRYVWAALEGLCGLEPSMHGVRVVPHLPPEWMWLAVRNVPVAGHALSWFVIRDNGERLYTTGAVESTLPTEVYERDVSADVRVEGEGLALVAFERASGRVVLVANRTEQTVNAVLYPEGALADCRLRRRYDSLRKRWLPGETEDRLVAVAIPSGEFTLCEFETHARSVAHVA